MDPDTVAVHAWFCVLKGARDLVDEVHRDSWDSRGRLKWTEPEAVLIRVQLKLLRSAISQARCKRVAGLAPPAFEVGLVRLRVDQLARAHSEMLKGRRQAASKTQATTDKRTPEQKAAQEALQEALRASWRQRPDQTMSEALKSVQVDSDDHDWFLGVSHTPAYKIAKDVLAEIVGTPPSAGK
jgi:hypothetical protein